MDAGWSQVVERSEPRLMGKARMEYTFATTRLNGLDAAYVPTLDEWMRIESGTPWTFYADGAFLEVNFTRERTLIDPTKPGAYVLTHKLMSSNEYYRAFAGPEGRLRWKELLPTELSKAAEQRRRKEAELRSKGFEIAESYVDPPPPDLK